MSQSNLLVSRFAVNKSGFFVYNQKFHNGVNIIRGVNGTGKSTVVDLMSYALGAVLTEWTKEQLSCDWVIVEVVLNGNIFCLRRDITESGQAKMDIFEGKFEDALNSVAAWTQYSMRRSNERHSFSQQIFELLGMPRHKTDDSKNLTLHQILRLMYVDQLSATTKLLKEDKEWDNATFRRAIGDYLLGIDDLEAHNLRQDLLSENKKFERLNGELNAIYRLFGNEVSQINEQALNNEISELELKVGYLKKRKREVLHDYSGEEDKLVAEKALTLQVEIEELFERKKKLESDKYEVSIELTDTELFVISLNERKMALEQSRVAFSSLGEIQFKYCPACLEPVLDQGRSSCCLCKTEARDGERDVAYVQMLNELNFQLRESNDLINEFREEMDSIASQLPRITRRIEEARFEYQELKVSVNAKDAIISEISSEMGFCKSQMIALEDRRENVNKVESMRNTKEKINKSILNIKDKLDAINAQQADRYNLVYDSIEATAGNLLSQDGGYEPSFDNVEEVSFDFSKDKMFVNGRSKFSASSMVIMKNSIRLAIFLHAVEDKYARLPNFMIMDNIEDKGMVDERSHNFQHLIISECKKLKKNYQLIFTTSMIAPDLNDTKFCVGPMYEKGMHTLEF
ncbi:AAA family ATPase [Vreelandella venusta]|uniref:AAA family ATPase n=1 Tax=Vreelandella venusta TaxID=44935 RepID=UPI00384EC2CE